MKSWTMWRCWCTRFLQPKADLFSSHDYTGAASYEEYTQTVLPCCRGWGNTVSPPIDRIFLLTDNTSIPEGYSTVYHMDSAPEHLLSEIQEDVREDPLVCKAQDGEQVLYYLCPIIAGFPQKRGLPAGENAGRKAVFRDWQAPKKGARPCFCWMRKPAAVFQC